MPLLIFLDIYFDRYRWMVYLNDIVIGLFCLMLTAYTIMSNYCGAVCIDASMTVGNHLSRYVYAYKQN
jgi:hypothetical protein